MAFAEYDRIDATVEPVQVVARTLARLRQKVVEA